jgi:hypothetical protein
MEKIRLVLGRGAAIFDITINGLVQLLAPFLK